MKMKKKKELLKALEKVTDFRVDKHKIEYSLSEVLFMSLFGILKGAESYKDLHAWMQYQENNEILDFS